MFQLFFNFPMFVLCLFSHVFVIVSLFFVFPGPRAVALRDLLGQDSFVVTIYGLKNEKITSIRSSSRVLKF